MSDARERLALAVFSLALLSATTLPYVAAFRATPADHVYLGTSDASADDYPSYLSRMRAAAQGRWLYASPYAPEPKRRLQLRPLYTALGVVSHALGAPLWVGYHAGRLFFGALCLLAIFAVARALARSTRERWTAFALASVGSGIGFLSSREGLRSTWSYDLWVPELNATHAILTNPHFPAAIALMLAALVGAARAIDTGRAAPALLGGVALGALTLVHPHDVLIVGAVLLLYGAVTLAQRAVALASIGRTALFLGVAALPAALWQIVAYAADPSLRQMVQAQPVGSPLAVASGVGLLAPLALLGLPALARRSALGGIIAAWVVVVPLLLLLPLPFPRRLAAGWHVPLGIASGIALAGAVGRIRRPALRGALLAGSLALVSLTSFDLIVYQMRRFASPQPGSFAWLPRDLLDAYAWLDANASAGDVVLAAYGPSNWLPVFTDLRPYFGQWAETPNAAARVQRVRAFFAPTTRNAARDDFLARSQIAWVLDSRFGALPGTARIRADRLDRVSLAASAGSVAILRVDQGRSTR